MSKPHSSSEAIQNRYDWSDTTPSTAVIEGIAILQNSEPTNFPEKFDPLFEYIDPDALDTLVTGDCPTTLTFSIEQYTIRIDGSTLHIWPD